MPNPTSDNVQADDHIREQAYYAWEADGRPEGQDVHHWERARNAASAIGSGSPLAPLLSAHGRYEGGVSAQPPVT